MPQSALSDTERGAIQNAREFCIEALGGRDRLNRMFFGGNDAANFLRAQVDDCIMRMLPRLDNKRPRL